MGANANSLRHTVAILFSESTRKHYANEAERLGETYEFTDANERSRKWLKGQWAYLAPNAVSAILHRFNVKHDVINESSLPQSLNEAHTLFVPNAESLSEDSIKAIEQWSSQDGHRLVVSGKTNLPCRLLGLTSLEFMSVTGHTGWQWTANSKFGNTEEWEATYLTSQAGYDAGIASAASDSTVLANLVEYDDIHSGEQLNVRSTLGPAVTVSKDDKVLYISNQVFEYLGGVLQGHLNVEHVRLQYNPTHWGDTIAFFLRGILQDTRAKSFEQPRLRSFGTYDGVLQLRHDMDHPPNEPVDLSMLVYQAQNAAPATHYLMDPLYCGDEKCTLAGSKAWLEACSKHNFIEAAVHNDSTQGDPPRYIMGRGLYEHIEDSDRRLGMSSVTAGRHMGFFLYPETIDAMDYLYENKPEFLGLCTFSLYDVIEYGDKNPSVEVHGKLVTYATYDHDDPSRPAGISGFWFPYHAVVTTLDEHKVLRGWDVTHDTDCDFERIDVLYEGRNSRSPSVSSTLENGVFTIHYEQQAANRPTVNEGRGHLPFLRYSIERAHACNFWIANKKDLYQRMQDYEDVVFRPLDPDGFAVYNPTTREIAGLMVQLLPDQSISGIVNESTGEISSHIVRDALVGLPPLAPNSATTFRYLPEKQSIPRVSQTNSNRIEIRSCRVIDGLVIVECRLIGRNYVVIEGLEGNKDFDLELKDNRGSVKPRIQSDSGGRLIVELFGLDDNIIDANVHFSLGRGGQV